MHVQRLLELEPHAPTEHHMQVTRSGPVALYVGEVSPGQHIDQLIAAYHVLLSHHRPDAKLVIVGPVSSHAYRFALDRQIRELNLPHAWIAGNLTEAEIVAMYRNVDLFVTCGAGDATVQAAVAAMAFGRPVVGRCIGGLPESVGRAGLLLAEHDGITVMAEVIAELLENERLRSALVERGRARVTELLPGITLPEPRQPELLTGTP